MQSNKVVNKICGGKSCFKQVVLKRFWRGWQVWKCLDFYFLKGISSIVQLKLCYFPKRQRIIAFWLIGYSTTIIWWNLLFIFCELKALLDKTYTFFYLLYCKFCFNKPHRYWDALNAFWVLTPNGSKKCFQ